MPGFNDLRNEIVHDVVYIRQAASLPSATIRFIFLSCSGLLYFVIFRRRNKRYDTIELKQNCKVWWQNLKEQKLVKKVRREYRKIG